MPTAVPFKQVNPQLDAAEKAAAGSVAWCVKELGLDSIPVPVPVDLWVERPMGLRLSIEPIELGDIAVEGAAIHERGEILINPQIVSDDQQFRFTCAHELGHLVLHQKARRVFRDISHLATAYHDLYERQADHFAGVFLMPLDPLFRNLVSLCLEHHVPRKALAETLIADNSVSERIWRQMVPAIAATFGAPQAAVVARFAGLRMNSGNTFLGARNAFALRRSLTQHGESGTVASTGQK